MAVDGGLRKIFSQRLPQGDWQAVETGLVAQGVPDANCCWQGREFWVEYKQTTTYRVKFRPAQCGWAERRIRHGGRVFLAVRRKVAAGPRRVAADELWLFDAISIRSIILGGLQANSAVLLGRWGGGPSQWPWAEVGTILRK